VCVCVCVCVFDIIGIGYWQYWLLSILINYIILYCSNNDCELVIHSWTEIDVVMLITMIRARGMTIYRYLSLLRHTDRRGVYFTQIDRSARCQATIRCNPTSVFRASLSPKASTQRPLFSRIFGATNCCPRPEPADSTVLLKSWTHIPRSEWYRIHWWRQ